MRRSTRIILTLAFALAFVFSIVGMNAAYAGCGGPDCKKACDENCDKACCDSGDMIDKASSEEKIMHKHAMMAEKLYHAEALYTCSQNSAFITDKADQKCPMCDMDLEKMSEKAVAELRESSPKGCSMCSIAVKGDSKMAECPGCKHALMPIEKQSHEQKSHETSKM